MKFLIALVVCGTLLVMTPAIFDLFHERNMVALNSGRSSREVLLYLPNAMDPENGSIPVARFGFWFTGSLAILCGVIGGFRTFARDRRES